MSAFPKIFIGPRRFLVTAVAALALGRVAAAVVSAFATRDMFVALGAGHQAIGAEFPTYLLVLLVVGGCLAGACRITENILAERLGQDFSKDLRAILFEHISRLPSAAFQDQRKGGLALRFVGDLGAIRGWVSKGLTRMIAALIVLPTTLGVLTVLHPILGLAAGLPLLAGLGALFLAGSRTQEVYRRVRSRRAQLATDITERVAIAPELRLLGRMPLELRKLDQKSRQLRTAAVIKSAVAGGLRAIPEICSGLAVATVLGSALALQLSVAETAGALVLVALLMACLRDLAGVWDRYRSWNVAREKCFKLLEIPTMSPPERTQRRRGTATPPDVMFRSICHGPLHDFDLTIAAGSTTALIGETGSGKSTLLSLAAGLEAPRDGKVLIGGRPAHTLPELYQKRRVTLINNRSPIMRGSVRKALTLGLSPRPSDATLTDVAKQCGLGGVLSRIGGLSGRVEEAGANLSEGERWRVLLARLTLGEFSLILLDSPETGLDQNSLRMLGQILLKKNATTLLATDSENLVDFCEAVEARLPGLAVYGQA